MINRKVLIGCTGREYTPVFLPQNLLVFQSVCDIYYEIGQSNTAQMLRQGVSLSLKIAGRFVSSYVIVVLVQRVAWLLLNTGVRIGASLFLYSLIIAFCTHRNGQLDFVVPTEILDVYFGMDTTDLCLLSIVRGL